MGPHQDEDEDNDAVVVAMQTPPRKLNNSVLRYLITFFIVDLRSRFVYCGAVVVQNAYTAMVARACKLELALSY